MAKHRPPTLISKHCHQSGKHTDTTNKWKILDWQWQILRLCPSSNASILNIYKNGYDPANGTQIQWPQQQKQPIMKITIYYHIFNVWSMVKVMIWYWFVWIWIGIFCARIKVIGFCYDKIGALNMNENRHGIIDKHWHPSNKHIPNKKWYYFEKFVWLMFIIHWLFVTAIYYCISVDPTFWNIHFLLFPVWMCSISINITFLLLSIKHPSEWWLDVKISRIWQVK